MRILISLIILFSLTYYAEAQQKYLVLNNGSVEDFESAEYKTGALSIIKEGSAEATDIPFKSIMGAYADNMNEMYYFRPDPTYKELFGYQFITRQVDGKIKVYKRVMRPAPESMTGVVGTINTIQPERTYLYLEKNNEFVIVLGSRDSKKDKVARLAEFVKDDPEVLEKVNSSNYSHKTDQIIAIVQEYNQKHHDSGAESREERMGKIDIQNSSKNTYKITAIGKEYTLEAHSTITLDTPIKTDVNICVEGNSQTACNIVVSTPYFDRKYKIAVAKSGDLKLKKVSN